MATGRKTMSPKRKGEKQYPMVSFEMPDFDGEFTLPKLDTLPLGIVAALDTGSFGEFITFLDKHAPDSAPAVRDIAGEEVEVLMEHWSTASGVTAGK
ncbi:hypothetical protein NQ036_03630 [Brevibacterium sp. 91QC2O2]|uniref:hypothetical protein n=1 Tax=Brevibacterium TaxID=1696 RepID=UPI00211CA6FA|nr:MULTISPECIES: hypothetical protein [unclassified Brevibacterium]MCQ9367337.1 hypothetical protein [Brevibacterium sp. 91QC2O2]MCQ9384650.1 hypothetical protein [Brevibacterium sp. 68QC2CO]